MARAAAKSGAARQIFMPPRLIASGMADFWGYAFDIDPAADYCVACQTISLFRPAWRWHLCLIDGHGH